MYPECWGDLFDGPEKTIIEMNQTILIDGSTPNQQGKTC